jgi:hypothetical protein
MEVAKNFLLPTNWLYYWYSSCLKINHLTGFRISSKERSSMSKKKKRLLWAAIALLLFLPPCYYLKSSFFDRKAQLQRESLLVRKGIIKPLERAEQEGEEVPPDLKEEAPTPFSTEEAREARRRALEAEIRKLEQELLAKEKGIEDWKHRWEEKNRELKRYKRELMVLRKEAALRERKLPTKSPPVGEGKRAKPEEQGGHMRGVRRGSHVPSKVNPVAMRGVASRVEFGLSSGSYGPPWTGHLTQGWMESGRSLLSHGGR